MQCWKKATIGKRLTNQMMTHCKESDIKTFYRKRKRCSSFNFNRLQMSMKLNGFAGLEMSGSNKLRLMVDEVNCDGNIEINLRFNLKP